MRASRAGEEDAADEQVDAEGRFDLRVSAAGEWTLEARAAEEGSVRKKVRAPADDLKLMD